MGQLFVYNNNQKMCSTTYEYAEESNKPRIIPIANYDNIEFVEKYITIVGILGIGYELAGKKTDIILSDENGSRKYFNCTVSHIYKDGYKLKYGRCERYE